MNFIEKVMTIERVDQLIRMKATGSPEELAVRLKISRSTVYHLIDAMRAMGAEICYCRSRKSFYYTREMTIKLRYMDSQKP